MTDPGGPRADDRQTDIPAHAKPAGPSEPTQLDEPEERNGLLQFLYQCPVGLIEIDDRGGVRWINPAAARMLAPALTPDEDLTELHPVLDRLYPGLTTLLSNTPTRTGPLHPGRRIVAAVGDPGRGDTGPATERIELRLHRVAPGQVMVVCSDVTDEQHLARRTLTLAGRLRDVVAATGAYRAAAADTLGISVSAVIALEELIIRGACTPSAIARRIGLTTTTLTSTIDQLEAAELVDRIPNPGDRRSVLVALTPDAYRRIGPVLELLTGGIDRVAEGTAGRDSDLAAILDAVTTALRTHVATPRAAHRSGRTT